FAGRDHGAVPPESDGMPVARRDRAVAIETNHPLATSEAGCVPATKRVASHVPASRLPPCGKCSAPETRFPCAGNRSCREVHSNLWRRQRQRLNGFRQNIRRGG